MDDVGGRQGSVEFHRYGSILPDTTNRRERGVAHFLKRHIGCAHIILGHVYDLVIPRGLIFSAAGAGRSFVPVTRLRDDLDRLLLHDRTQAVQRRDNRRPVAEQRGPDRSEQADAGQSELQTCWESR